MERYKGLQDGDEIIGGGSYVKIEGCGHEVCNFAEVNGTLYGYVQPPGSQIDIDRLGAQPDDDEISNITVVWTATRPTGGTAVIGWYKNATVFRKKSTFLKILSGELEHDSGDVVIGTGERMAVLKQEHFAFDEYSVKDTVMMGFPKLYECAKAREATTDRKSVV